MAPKAYIDFDSKGNKSLSFALEDSNSIFDNAYRNTVYPNELYSLYVCVFFRGIQSNARIAVNRIVVFY